MFSRTVTPTKTWCCLGFYTVVMLISFFTHNFHKNPGCVLLLCTTSESKNLFSCSVAGVFIPPVLIFHFEVSLDGDIQFFQPWEGRLVSGHVAAWLAGQSSSSSYIMKESRPMSPFHRRNFTQISHCCLSAGDLESSRSLFVKQWHSNGLLKAWSCFYSSCSVTESCDDKLGLITAKANVIVVEQQYKSTSFTAWGIIVSYLLFSCPFLFSH